MTLWRRWVFEIRAPGDEFLALFSRILIVRGVRVDEGEHFALVARGFGARAFVSTQWVDGGLEVRAKIKAGLFSSAPALERMLLEAGREAQAKLTYEKEARE